MTIATETWTLIECAREGDPALAGLSVTGLTPGTLAVHLIPGTPSTSIGGTTYDPTPPFRREILVELIVRMQRLRWQRVSTITGLLQPPEDMDLLALSTRHERATASFECGSGWTDLLDALFTWLQEVAADREWAPDQIKEKYGTIRVYWHGDLPALGDEIVEAAEHVSAHLCEVCGAPGALRSQHGWFMTRCHEHKTWRY